VRLVTGFLEGEAQQMDGDLLHVLDTGGARAGDCQHVVDQVA
jgi:hypothetical protein